MRVVDPVMLQRCRDAKVCEYCRKPAKCDPAHIFSRGAGRLDIAVNLVALCRHDHSMSHAGEVPTKRDLLAIVANRDGCKVADIEAVINYFRKLPKGTDAHSVYELAAFDDLLGVGAFTVLLNALNVMPDQSSACRPLVKKRKRKTAAGERAKAARKAQREAAKKWAAHAREDKRTRV